MRREQSTTVVASTTKLQQATTSNHHFRNRITLTRTSCLDSRDEIDPAWHFDRGDMPTCCVSEHLGPFLLYLFCELAEPSLLPWHHSLQRKGENDENQITSSQREKHSTIFWTHAPGGGMYSANSCK